jgi:hypothetical protein
MANQISGFYTHYHDNQNNVAGGAPQNNITPVASVVPLNNAASMLIPKACSHDDVETMQFVKNTNNPAAAMQASQENVRASRPAFKFIDDEGLDVYKDLPGSSSSHHESGLGGNFIYGVQPSEAKGQNVSGLSNNLAMNMSISAQSNQPAVAHHQMQSHQVMGESYYPEEVNHYSANNAGEEYQYHNSCPDVKLKLSQLQQQ